MMAHKLYVHPASHGTKATTDADAERSALRIASTPEVHVRRRRFQQQVLQCARSCATLQKYGMFLSDGGSVPLSCGVRLLHDAQVGRCRRQYRFALAVRHPADRLRSDRSRRPDDGDLRLRAHAGRFHFHRRFSVLSARAGVNEIPASKIHEVAAVHRNVRAGDEAGFVGGEEIDDARDFRRFAEASDRNAGDDLVAHGFRQSPATIAVRQ